MNEEKCVGSWSDEEIKFIMKAIEDAAIIEEPTPASRGTSDARVDGSFYYTFRTLVLISPQRVHLRFMTKVLKEFTRRVESEILPAKYEPILNLFR